MLLIVLLSSGNPVYLNPGWSEPVLLLTAVILLAVLTMRGARISGRDLAVLAAFAGLIALHLLTVSGATIFSGAGFLVRLLIGWAAFRLVSDAPRVLVVVLASLAALALVMFVVDRLLFAAGIDLATVLAPLSLVHGEYQFVSTPFHTFPGGVDRHRNAGVFWEPGALSGYSLLGLLLLAFLPKGMPRQRLVATATILSLAVLSTQSTTGYVVLPLVLFLLFMRLSSARGGGVVAIALAAVLPLLAVAAIVAYELPFMREKIESQVQSVQAGEGEWELTRLGTLINDVADIRERPLVGWGANPLIRPSQLGLSETARATQGNGFANWLVRFGLVGLTVFLVSLAVGLRGYGRASRSETWLAVGIVCLLLQGEAFLNYPLFLGLMFIAAMPAVRRYWVLPLAAAPSR
jgi:hypothetical protein